MKTPEDIDDDEKPSELDASLEASLFSSLSGLGDTPFPGELDDLELVRRSLNPGGSVDLGAGPANDVHDPIVSDYEASGRRVIFRRQRKGPIVAAVAGIGIAATFLVALAMQVAGRWHFDGSLPSSSPRATVAAPNPTIRSLPPSDQKEMTVPAVVETSAPSAEVLPSAAPPAPAIVPAVTRESAEDLLLRAEHQLGSGKTDEASATYQRLASEYPGSAEAQAALVSLGQIHLGGGNASGALSDYDRYLAGGGPLAAEAEAGRIEALKRLGRSADERQAIEAFLAKHPNGMQSTRLQARLAELSK